MDTSVRNTNPSGQRVADSLLRTTGGTTANLLVPPAGGDGTDAGQLGLNAPNLQQLALGPAAFRRSRALMQEGDQPRFELLISATAVQQQVGLLALDSAEALFRGAAGVLVGGKLFEIESWSSSQALGQAYLYRLELRSAQQQSLTQLS